MDNLNRTTVRAADGGLLSPPAPHLLDPEGVTALYNHVRPQKDEQNQTTAFCLMNWPRLYELEQRLFANQPSQLSALDNNPLDGDVLIKQIEKWLQRIDNHYFPVQVDIEGCVEIAGQIAWPLDQIPMLPMGVHYYEPDDLYCTGVLANDGILDLMMCLAAPECETCWSWDTETQRLVNDQMQKLYPLTRSLPPSFALSKIVPSLRHYRPDPPLDDVLHLCLLVLQQTNSCWLDISHEDYWESYQPLCWDTADEVDYLRTEWQDAKIITAACERMQAWCDSPQGEEKTKRQCQVVRLLYDRWHMVSGQLQLPLQFE